MKILVTGNGKSGSWRIRGDQLGRAIGADVEPMPRALAGYDRMVLVKRYQHEALHRAHAARVPVVFDVVDAWQSALGNERTRGAACRWLQNTIAIVNPAAIVTTTKAMADDCKDLGLPTLALPHHARPGIAINPIREVVQRVGYEGSERYLGWWRQFLERECLRRGWTFVINPPELADLDIVVAVRDDDGYAARSWKSNVKLANAQASGTPCILNLEMGYFETSSGAEQWANTAEEVTAAFDVLTPYGERLDRHKKLREATIPLERVAHTYREWLCASSF